MTKQKMSENLATPIYSVTLFLWFSEQMVQIFVIKNNITKN